MMIVKGQYSNTVDSKKKVNVGNHHFMRNKKKIFFLNFDV